MFSFQFNLPKNKNDLEIVINEYSFKCSKINAEKISKTIHNHNSQKNKSKKEANTFIISISEFQNTLICSEDDYKIFENIFCQIPINITSTNKNVLKIFATKLEITELSTLISLFEQLEDTINNDANLQILKDISNKLINITEEDFDNLFDNFKNVQEDILTQEFIYNLFLVTCLMRPAKIEILMDFLKKYEELTKGGQYEYFKKLICDEYTENPSSNEIRFLVSFLHSKNKVNEMPKTSKYPYFTGNNDKLQYIEKNENKDEVNKVCQAIKDDDIDSFTEIITNGGKEMEFNKEFPHSDHERSTDIMMTRTYIDLAAFYGSERIFNYILLNVEDQVDTLNQSKLIFALIGGNISIVRKYLDNIEMTDQILIKSLLTTIKYNHNEIFEYLFENYNPMKFMDNKVFHNAYHPNLYRYYWIRRFSPNERLNFNDLMIVNAIQYNNYEVICYLITNGFDYTCLFALSLIYNQFYLAEFTLKLPYECIFSSKSISNKFIYPFLYKYDNESALFISIYKNRPDFVKTIIDSKGFKPNVSFDNAGPLFFAVMHNKIDIVKLLIKDKRFLKQVCKNISIFQYAVGHGYKEMSEFLLNESEVNKNGQWEYFLANSIQNEVENIGHNYYYDNNPYKDNEGNPENFVNFFFSKSENKTTNDNKTKLIKQNKILFACLAAKYCNEEEFEKFLDDYSIDINSVEVKTV